MEYLEDVECSNYFQEHKIDDLLHDLKYRISSVKPADPLKFLHSLIGHWITLRQDINFKRDSKIISPRLSLEKLGEENTHPLILGTDEVRRWTAFLKTNAGKKVVSDTSSTEELEIPNKTAAPARIRPTHHGAYSSTLTPKISVSEGCFGHQHAMNWQDEVGEDGRRSRTSSRIITLESGESVILDSFLQKSVEPATIWAIDIGGSLSKMVVWEPKNLAVNSPLHDRLNFLKSQDTYGESGHRDRHMEIPLENGTFHFIYFLTNRMEEATKLFSDFVKPGEVVAATGGGAYKYADFLMRKTLCVLVKFDELKSLLFGLDFLLSNVEDECFYFKNPSLKEEDERGYQNTSQNTYPYLLCNIGSGVSIMRVMGPHRYERVSGSCIGGGTFIGLCRLLCGGSTPEQRIAFDGFDAFKMASGGVANNVDMTVGDIYGGAYKSFNLRADTVASAFGKLATKPSLLNSVNPSDLARSLLNMIGMNIAQLAYLCAMRYKITNILFCGNFLRQKHNKLSQGSISYSIHYWSKGTMKACFLKHEGYLGSMGAYVLRNRGPLQTPDSCSGHFSERSNKPSETLD